MSHINFDFLTDSILFGSNLEDDFEALNEGILREELARYREYVLENFNEIKKEVIMDNRKITVTIESFGKRPDNNILKQLALYIDCVLIADPLFSFTEEKNEINDAWTEYLGIKNDGLIDRKKLSEALKYMKSITNLIVCDYVKFVPISILHEAPKEVPIRFDEYNFSEVLPKGVMDFLRKNIEVHNIKRTKGGVRVYLDEPLKKGTGLYMSFPGCPERMGEIVQYTNMQYISEDSTGRMLVKIETPDTITDEEFRIWLNQSINTASQKLYAETYQELYFSQMLHSMYMTRSQLKADLLAMDIKNDSMYSSIANLALKLEVPVFCNVDLKDIIEIRQNYGQSFRNFRSKLGEKLIKLNGLKDDEMLKRELDAVSYEITETYINDIAKEISSLKRSIGMDGIILTGTLLTSYATGGLSLLGSVAATISAMKDSTKLFGDVRENPGYFLWKIDKKNRRKW